MPIVSLPCLGTCSAFGERVNFWLVSAEINDHSALQTVLIGINFSALFPHVSHLLQGTSRVFMDFRVNKTSLQCLVSEM